MRTPILLLPSLMLLGAALVLNQQAAPHGVAGAEGAHSADARALQQERREISDRLERLEMERQHVLPRGGI